MINPEKRKMWRERRAERTGVKRLAGSGVASQ